MFASTLHRYETPVREEAVGTATVPTVGRTNSTRIKLNPRRIAMRFSLLIASVLCVAGVGAKVFGSMHQTQPVASHVYVVKPGDTLYSIALRNAGHSSLSQYLFALEEENGGSAHIVVGQRLDLPQS